MLMAGCGWGGCVGWSRTGSLGIIKQPHRAAPALHQGGKLPRASYDGIVTVRCRGRRLFIAPARKPQPAAAGAGADAAAAAGAAAADPAAHAAGAATKVGR